MSTTIYVLSRNMKIIRVLSENFHFLEVKFSVYLNRRLLVMGYIFENKTQKQKRQILRIRYGQSEQNIFI